jgi:hypothetical protein
MTDEKTERAEYRCPHGWASGEPYCPECIAELVRRAEEAEARAERLAKALRRGSKALRRAWDLFQNSGVMREPDGKTGSPELDELGNLLDEMAAFGAALANTEEK